jgi:hypothetical protein
MTEPPDPPFKSPFTAYPGGGPSVATGPEEGTKELWLFFWLAILNTVIIAAAGIGTWLLVAPH